MRLQRHPPATTPVPLAFGARVRARPHTSRPRGETTDKERVHRSVLVGLSESVNDG